MIGVPNRLLKVPKFVIVQANCVRIGSHSNSDKHTLYRDENELTYVKSADPLYKFHRMLIRYGRFTELKIASLSKGIKVRRSITSSSQPFSL